jgi:hypothetical protein
MDRQELTALRDVLDLVLQLPDNVRTQVAAWIAPEPAPKPGNGLDPHPPRFQSVDADSTPRRAKAPPQTKFNTRTTELRLLRALRESPTGLTAGALARSVGGAHTTTAVRLRDMGARGLIEKDAEGLWRLAGDEAIPTSQRADVGPTQPSAAAAS